MKTPIWMPVMAAVWILGAFPASIVAQDPDKGAALFRQCAACHSLVPGQHLTGPSLAGIMGRKAGTAEGFGRYSPAMKQSNVEWSAETIDPWLKSPGEFIPGTSMRVPGIDDPAARRELIAYLEVVTTEQGASEPGREAPGDMMGGGGPGRMPNLKQQVPTQQVTAIRYCGDAYFVTLGTGTEVVFWEFNLRLKTDSSANGPPKGKPAILRAGMGGDRAFVIFSEPGEISEFIEPAC